MPIHFTTKCKCYITGKQIPSSYTFTFMLCALKHFQQLVITKRKHKDVNAKKIFMTP